MEVFGQMLMLEEVVTFGSEVVVTVTVPVLEQPVAALVPVAV